MINLESEVNLYIYLKEYSFFVAERKKNTSKKSEKYLLLFSEDTKKKPDYISSLYLVKDNLYIFDTCLAMLNRYNFYKKYFKVNLDDAIAIEITRAEYYEHKNNARIIA